jgi:hypothetical protein
MAVGGLDEEKARMRKQEEQDAGCNEDADHRRAGGYVRVNAILPA